MKLNRKGYSRIYTSTQEDVERIKQFINEMDEFEYEYLPENLITVFEGRIEFVYNHKFFEIDMDELVYKCYNAGFWMFYVIDPNYPHIP